MRATAARRRAAGTGKVSHKGWPKITGILWKVLDSGNHQRTGTEDNDELLGHHGNEKVIGGAGKDVLWGDWDPKNNGTKQSDVLRGGDGNDFLYPSHGKNLMYGGRGNDRIIAYYGHGTIDCGPGAKDYAQTAGRATPTRSATASSSGTSARSAQSPTATARSPARASPSSPATPPC